MKKIRRGLWFDGKRKARLEVTIPGTRGAKRRRKTVSAANRAEAEALFRSFREEVLNPTAGATSEDTLEGFVTKNWPISRDKRRPISKPTAARELSALRTRILPNIGRLALGEITEGVIEDFSAYLLSIGNQNSTVNDRLRVLHKILAHAERRGICRVPALRLWPTPLPETELHQELSADELCRFLAAFESGVVGGGAGGELASRYNTNLFRWAKPLFVCAVHLGLARADLLNLRWSSVDFERNMVFIDRKKTGVMAVVPMSDAAREALLICRGRAVVSSEFCFLTPSGRLYPEITFRRHFLQAKKIAGIARRVRPHDLRHSFGSLLRSRGVDLGVIQKAMGHSTSRMTERYARVSLDALRPIADALNQL